MLSRTKNTLKVYKSYNFIDKDPIIDYTRTKVFANGGPSKIAKDSGVSPTTLYNWYHKKTRRPQFSTVAAVLLACGESTLDLRKLRK
jgi:DNA-binding phage protein